MLDDNFLWLINWYACQCDGDWEHMFGIKISTLDNPGWRILISIKNTELKNKQFPEICTDRSDTDWFFCKIENEVFEGHCGSFNFGEMLQTFRAWAEK